MTLYGQIVVNTTDYEAVTRLIDKGDAWLSAEFPQAEPRFRKLKMATQDKYSLESALFWSRSRSSAPPDKRSPNHFLNKNEHIKYVRDDWRQRS